jgi:hypothetical protein
MALHLCLALPGLALLLLAIREKAPTLLWPATFLITASAALHIATIPLFLVAIVFALSQGAVGAVRTEPSFHKHVLLCLAGGMVCLFLHALSIDTESLARGVREFGMAHRIFAWATVSNILWDPTLTPALLAPLALLGAVLMCIQRRGLAWLLLFSSVLLIPMSFSVCACRTDALRYQTPTHWIYYLLAAFPFCTAGRAAAPRRGRELLALSAAAILMLVATSAPGLRALASGDEEVQEYRFMRRVASLLPPDSVIWLPARSAANALQTDFPTYLRGQRIIRGEQAGPVPDGGLVFLGLDCYRLSSGEESFDRDSGLRWECLSACGGRRSALLEARLSARLPRWGFQKRFWSLSTEAPLVGIYRCAADKG